MVYIYKVNTQNNKGKQSNIMISWGSTFLSQITITVLSFRQIQTCCEICTIKMSLTSFKIPLLMRDVLKCTHDNTFYLQLSYGQVIRFYLVFLPPV